MNRKLASFVGLFLFISALLSAPVKAEEATVHNNEELFKQFVYEIRDLYRPIIAEQPFELVFVPQWNKTAVDSYTILASKHMIFINGGIARAKYMTKDALALVVCHEIGHNLGGYPQKPFIGGAPWSSAEGQADYYAASKCLKRYFDENYREVDNGEVVHSPLALDRCREVYREGREFNTCLRIVKAGEAIIATLSAEYLGHTNQSIATPSTFVVDETNVQYPSMQCRLDTYFRGALCDFDYHGDEYCTDKDRPYGARPHCWFKPQE